MSNVEKKYTLEIYDNKEEWLKNRGFGGSSASAILDKNPWQSKLDLYTKIVMGNNNKKVDIQNESTIYGTKAEPLIRNLFALDFEEDYIVYSPKDFEMYRRIDKPYLTATLDGRLESKKVKDKKLVIEIKTHDIRNNADYERWKTSLPDNYYIQCLHYLVVMNDYDGVILCAKLRFFDYSNKSKTITKQEIRYYYIDREECIKEIEYLENKETEFYEENVVKKQIPEITIKI